MKVKPNIEVFIDYYFKEHSNKVYNLFDNKKKFIEFFKEQLDVKGNIDNIKIYSASNEIFDTEKYFNKNDTPVDSESNNIKD